MDYNDRELLDYIYEGNEEAQEILYKKYEPYIKTQAKKVMSTTSTVGIEEADLIQEGMIALNEAIWSYKTNRETTFYTYATACVHNYMVNAIITANRMKHRVLNESVSLDSENLYSLGNFIADRESNPERKVIESERQEGIILKLKEILTDFEYQVFDLKSHNLDYLEIAKILDKTPKSIDNALHRIRIKINKMLEEEKKV